MRKLLAILFVAYIAISVFSPKNQTQEVAAQAKPVEKSPEQLAREHEEEARFKQTRLIATMVKTALREPDSVVWSSIRSNDDASIVCLEYRARNGFGGTNLERTSYTKGRLQTSAEAWRRACTHQLRDMGYVKHAL